MKALVWHGGDSVTWEQTPRQTPADDEVELKVLRASICGSDLHALHGNPGPRTPPLVLGHEAVGELDGALYVPFPLTGCGHCRACESGRVNLCPSRRLLGMHQSGVFSERVTVARKNLVPVPADLSPDRAVLAEPLACAVGALDNCAFPLRGARLLILGCGAIGLLAAAYAGSQGCEVVGVDPHERRRQAMQRMGATAVTESSATVGSFDVVLDAAGTPETWSTAIEAVEPGGTVVVLGLARPVGEISMASVVRRSVTLKGHFAYTRTDFDKALHFLAEQPFTLSWVDHMPMPDGPAAIKALIADPNRFIKFTLTTSFSTAVN